MANFEKYRLGFTYCRVVFDVRDLFQHKKPIFWYKGAKIDNSRSSYLAF